jgi:hypothetical protein
MGHAPDCNQLEHLVRRSRRFVAKGFVLTPNLKAKGWSDAGIFQGQQAIERFLCRPCIVAAEESAELKRYRDKIALEAENGGQKMTMYQVLCS